VSDRRIDGEEIEFGTSGYTLNNVFVLYDRKTDSVWYPLEDDAFDAVAGPLQGMEIEFLAEPEVMRLREWRKKHPDTLVLLPPKRTG